jgi:DNA-binding CsgD family transcriptional regulator
VAYLRISLVTLNTAAFVALLLMSVTYWRKESSARIRPLWLIVALASAALVVGSVQRLAIQATTLGWLPNSTDSILAEEWQLVQSIVVAGLAIAAFVSVKKLADSMAASERIAGSILERVDHVDLRRLGLTNREEEVLALIGNGLITDAELATALHISRSTVQTHLKSLLRKTGLHRRQDLVAVALLVASANGTRSS